MSLVNVASLALAGPINDALVAGPASTQATALRLAGGKNRCVSAAANGSFVLPSILSGEAGATASEIKLINDSAQTVVVYPAAGENHNGVANATLSVAAGRTGVFLRVANSQGGPDWRSAAIA